MKTQLITVLLLGIFCTNITHTQTTTTNCFMGKIMEFNQSQLNNEASAQTIAEKYRNSWGRLPNSNSLAEWQQIKRCLEQQNNGFKAKINSINAKLTNLNNQKNTLLKNKDLAALKEQIESNKKAINEITNNLKTQLDNYEMQGVYGVLINEGPGVHDFSYYEGEARDAIAPSAIKEINGEFIQSFQQYLNSDNRQIFNEKIIQTIQGELSVHKEEVLSDYVGKGSTKKALIIFTVSVANFKKNTLAKQSVLLSSDRYTLINNVQDLQKIVFTNESQKNSFIQKWQDFESSVREANKNSNATRQEITNTANNDIKVNANTLKTAQENYQLKLNQVRTIFQNQNLSFDERNLTTQIPTAINNIDNAIESLQNELQKTKTEIYFFEEKKSIPYNSRQPIPDLVNSLISTKNDLNERGKIDQYKNQQELNNQQFSEQNDHNVRVNNVVQKCWVYIFENLADENNEKYEINIVYQYTQGKTTNTPVNKIVNKKNEENDDNNNNNNISNTELILNLPKTELVYVEGGTFTMGCTGEQGSDCYDYEKPAHTVSLSSYYIGKYEVTQALWRSVMGSNPSNFSGCDDCPVENVSWEQCMDFIRELNRQTGKKYRLPTEAEWEYAARGGLKGLQNPTKYSGGFSIDNVAWYDGNSDKKTHPVGTKRANDLGIYDMSGNVWEWCSDWWNDSYSSSSQSNPTGPSAGSDRVYRGGSWSNSPRYCRVSPRFNDTPSNRYNSLGLRLCL